MAGPWGTTYPVSPVVRGSDNAEAARFATAGRRFQTAVIVQVILCALPVAAMLALGMARMAGLAFWGIFALLLLRLAILGRHDEFVALLIALVPFSNLLRGFAFYSVVVTLFGLGAMYYNMRSPGTIWTIMRRFRFVAWMFVYITFYYLFSLILTGKYDVNLRMFEMALAVLAVLILGRNGDLIATTLLGLVVSACCIGLAMLPHIGNVADERLGMIVLNGYSLGNPVQIGIPLALSFLALTIGRGKWVRLQYHLMTRMFLLIPTIALLALTSSRASWLVAAGGLLVTLLLGHRTRVRMLVLIGLGALAIQLVLLSPFGGGLQRGIDRTFGEDRSARNRTSGRSDQWVVAYHAFTESMGRMIHGHGPGLGQDVYASYSRRIPTVEFEVGKRMALHSLYMQIGVEAGFLGLAPMLVWFVAGMYRIILWVRRHGDVFPLVTFLGFIFVAVTTSGFDTVSGTLLGIGLLATARHTESRSGNDRPDHRLQDHVSVSGATT